MKEYLITQGNKTAPATTNRVPATCSGEKTAKPYFMSIKELPQIQPSKMMMKTGNQEYFTVQNSLKIMEKALNGCVIWI